MVEHLRDASGSDEELPIDEARVHAELSQIILGDTPLLSILETVAHLARRAIPSAGQVSVTLIEPSGEAHSVAFTGDLAVQLDERQYEKGYGPCMDAAQVGKTIAIRDTTDSESYPGFASQCARMGVTNTLSVGMPIPQRSVGAINVYGFGETFDPDTVELVESLAGYAAVAMANAALFDRTQALARQLEEAMRSRSVIEQAKGIVMARDRCTEDEAFKTLIKASQQQNRKLRDVAQDLVSEQATP